MLLRDVIKGFSVTDGDVFTFSGLQPCCRQIRQRLKSLEPIHPSQSRPKLQPSFPTLTQSRFQLHLRPRFPEPIRLQQSPQQPRHLPRFVSFPLWESFKGQKCQIFSPLLASSTTTTQPPTQNLCQGQNLRFVADPTACYRYFWCFFSLPVPGECASDRIFMESLQGCVRGDRNTCTRTSRSPDIAISLNSLNWISFWPRCDADI